MAGSTRRGDVLLRWTLRTALPGVGRDLHDGRAHLPRGQGHLEGERPTGRRDEAPVTARAAGQHLHLVDALDRVRHEVCAQCREVDEGRGHPPIQPRSPDTTAPYARAMSAETFFEPWPDPEDHDDGQVEVDLPWMPPVHVVGVVVPLDLDVHRGPDVVVRVTHAVAHRRGLELHVGTWVRPGARRDLASADHVWHEQEPRVGIRLADGTRLGHRPPHAEPPPGEEPPTATFTQVAGNGGGLHSTSSWWVHPLPDGDVLDVVIQWEHQGVPESSATVPLTPLREAAEREDVLWDPPPTPADQSFGWFAYAPMGGQVYRSNVAVVMDDEDGDEPSEG